MSNKGFDRFTVTIPAGATVTNTSFRNGNGTTGAWNAAVGSTSVTWSAGSQPTLDWGTMYTFSMTVNAAPNQPPAVPEISTSRSAHVILHVANAGAPTQYLVSSLVPTNM